MCRLNSGLYVAHPWSITCRNQAYVTLTETLQVHIYTCSWYFKDWAKQVMYCWEELITSPTGPDRTWLSQTGDVLLMHWPCSCIYQIKEIKPHWISHWIVFPAKHWRVVGVKISIFLPCLWELILLHLRKQSSNHSNMWGCSLRCSTWRGMEEGWAAWDFQLQW